MAVIDSHYVRSLLDVLYEDVLVRMCRFLPATSLLSTGVACSEVHERTQQSVELWKGLCSFLLGETSLLLHERRWGSVAVDKGTAGFYRRLFQATWACENFCYDHECREQLLSSIHDGLTPGSNNRSVAHRLLCMSGHTAEALGPLVLQVGGMRNEMGPDETVHVTVINLDKCCILEPKLSADSLRPAQRMRHTTCVVRAQFLPVAAFSEAILLLGGHDANIRSRSAGEPRASVKDLLFLQFTHSDGSEIRWSEVSASGNAPAYIYNHACATFAEGRRVCVFGGDMPTSDLEFARIERRSACSFVYVLDVEKRYWEPVTTFGQIPAWRSFHAAVSYTSLLDGLDYLVTFGGTDEHCEPLSGGTLADMRGYRLNLSTFQWSQGPSSGFTPTPRMRFGVARWGRHLIIHGGHGQERLQEDSYIARLNLSTLCWSSLNFSNAPPLLPRSAFETGSPTAGCVVGGAQQTMFGPNILTRLVVFRLRDAATPEDGASTTSEVLAQEVEYPDANQMVQVRIRGPDDEGRVLQIAAALFATLQQRAGENEALEQLLQILVREQTDGQSESDEDS